MEITREYLEATMQNLNTQREDFYASFQRVEGAIKLCQAMLDRLVEEAPPEAEGVKA